jgi:hypothetical protein
MVAFSVPPWICVLGNFVAIFHGTNYFPIILLGTWISLVDVLAIFSTCGSVDHFEPTCAFNAKKDTRQV